MCILRRLFQNPSSIVTSNAGLAGFDVSANTFSRFFEKTKQNKVSRARLSLKEMIHHVKLTTCVTHSESMLLEVKCKSL